jgi:hypothetical protein
MSLRQKVKLELEDGKEVVVEYSAIDLRAWETKHKKSALDESLSVSMLSWLGWNAAHRQGLLNGDSATYESFDALCVSVEGVSDDEERPTKKVAAKKSAATPKEAGQDSSAP